MDKLNIMNTTLYFSVIVILVSIILFLIYHLFKNKIRMDDSNKLQNIKISLQEDIINQVHDSIISADLNGYILSWNKGSERLLGYKKEDVVGKHITKIYPEYLHEHIESTIIPTLLKEKFYETEIELLNNLSQKVYVHLSLSVLRNSSNKPIGFIGYALDINNKDSAKLTLTQSQKFLEKAHALTKFGHWKMNVKTKKIWSSEQNSSIFGLKNNQVTQETFLNLVHPDYKEQLYLSITKSIETGAARENIYRIIINGKNKWIHSLGWANVDNNGEVIEILGTVQDITKQKELELKLQESENRFKSIFNLSPDPALLILNNKFIECNQATLDILGYKDKNDFINTHPSKISPEYQPDGKESLAKANQIF